MDSQESCLQESANPHPAAMLGMDIWQMSLDHFIGHLPPFQKEERKDSISNSMYILGERSRSTRSIVLIQGQFCPCTPGYIWQGLETFD